MVLQKIRAYEEGAREIRDDERPRIALAAGDQRDGERAESPDLSAVGRKQRRAV